MRMRRQQSSRLYIVGVTPVTPVIMKETEIQNAVCKFLSEKGYFFWRSNNTPVFDKKRGLYRSLPKYGMKGVSDIILLLDGTAWFIEIKRPKTYLSKNQKEFKKNVERNGCYFLTVRSIDDLTREGF